MVLGGHERGTVLIVEDESYVSDLLHRWLDDAGYSCRTAQNADEAWRALEVAPVQLITLDVTLPGTSGLDILPSIKAQFPEVEIVMITALADTQAAIKALSTGASGYLIKPVAREELLFQADKALERWQLLRERRMHTEELEIRVREQTREIRLAHEETIHLLVAASAYRDEETGAHIQRVGLFSALLAKAAGWSAAQVDRIRMAAPMHDIGKMGIPDAILQKPGKLTIAEFEVMKRHATIGASLLEGCQSPLLKMAQEIAHCHHERWDGSGYPRGLKGDAIPEAARIVAIVDVFDALTHDRVYRSALPAEEAVRVIDEGCGSQFDPRFVDVFVEIMPDLLKLSNVWNDASSDFASEEVRDIQRIEREIACFF